MVCMLYCWAMAGSKAEAARTILLTIVALLSPVRMVCGWEEDEAEYEVWCAGQRVLGWI